GEGGAKRRMRARAKRAALALPRQHQKHASLRSRPLIHPPGTFSRKREKGFLPFSRRKIREAALLLRNGRSASSVSSLPLRPEAALPLRSGRRGRAAPDEGASAASCSCPPNPEKQRQKQRFAALAPPHPPSGHLLP